MLNVFHMEMNLKAKVLDTKVVKCQLLMKNEPEFPENSRPLDFVFLLPKGVGCTIIPYMVRQASLERLRDLFPLLQESVDDEDDEEEEEEIEVEQNEQMSDAPSGIHFHAKLKHQFIRTMLLQIPPQQAAR